MILGLIGRALDTRNDVSRGRKVRIADSETDDVDAFGLDFLLEAIELGKKIRR
jgi:hypothetical protein